MTPGCGTRASFLRCAPFLHFPSKRRWDSLRSYLGKEQTTQTDTDESCGNSQSWLLVSKTDKHLWNDKKRKQINIIHKHRFSNTLSSLHSDLIACLVPSQPSLVPLWSLLGLFQQLWEPGRMHQCNAAQNLTSHHFRWPLLQPGRVLKSNLSPCTTDNLLLKLT